jgi:hypothetical protein
VDLPAVSPGISPDMAAQGAETIHRPCMKLIFAELGSLRRYVSRELAYVVTSLVEEQDWRHLEPYEVWSSPGALRDKILRELGELPEVVLCLGVYDFLNAHAGEIERLGCRKYIFVDDLHWWDEDMRAMKNRSFFLCDGILCAYEPAFHRFYPRLALEKEVSWLPHSASPDFVLEYNEHPEAAVFLSGAINQYYPLRQAMLRLYERGEHAIVFQEHAGYHCSHDYGQDGDVGRSFAEKLRRRLVGFTDCSTFRYTVAKYFEIPATGALLLAEGAVSRELATLGFEEGIHYVPVCAEDLEDRLGYVLDARNREEIDTIRRRGQELVRTRHTTGHRARQIDELCR